MSSTYAPTGLMPAYHPSGTIRSESATIASAYGTQIFQNAPVGIAADGTLIAAAAGAHAMGSFYGVEYVQSDGRPIVSNQWPAGQVATQIVAYYSRDPDIVYMIQADDTLAQAVVGNEYDWTTNDSTAGNTTTGISSVGLDVSTVAANAGLQVLGFVPRPDNAAGDSFPWVYVRISEHQLRADAAFVPTV
jgi:hypothetical protein